MAFIYLQPEQEYRDLDQVKAEMADVVLDFKPSTITSNIQVPFLSSSEGIGQVNIREQSSAFIIEDCLCGTDGEWRRRLRFHTNPNLIQSEVNLRLNPKTNDRECSILRVAISRRHSLVQPDYSTLDNDYHGVIVTCLKAHFLAQSE